MYFLDYYGPGDLYQEVREPLQRELAAAFRATPSAACVRRILTEDERPEVELWVELSSEEQLIRFGRDIAARLSAVVREASALEVWVMFRIVPLSHAFLNGVPRGRARAWYE
jgi:hypothetical protein